MRITSKGQVTIPQHIREQAGLHPLTEVEFAYVDGVVTVRPTPGGQDRGKRLVANLRGRGDGRMTTDEIMALTRGE